MDVMELRRGLLMSMAETSGIPSIEITVNTSATIVGDLYDAVASLIDTTNHPRWFAFVDDNTYWTGGDTRVCAILGNGVDTGKSIFLANSSYGYTRRYAYPSSTTSGVIPQGTKFKVIYLP